MMTQRERDKILIHLLQRWNATPDQFFWGTLVNLPGRTPSITVIDYLHDPHQSYDPSNPAADQLLLPKDIAEQYRFFYKPLEPILHLRIDDPQLCWRFSFGSKVRFHVTLKNLSGTTLLYLKATDLEYITVNMKIEAVQPKTQTITHKVYSSPISSVQSAILREQPHSTHSPSENAYAKPFGNYGIRQELLKEFSRKESEEKEEQAKLSSAPKSAAPVTSTKPEEKPSRAESTITVKKGWKKERNQHVEHITQTVHTRTEEQPLPSMILRNYRSLRGRSLRRSRSPLLFIKKYLNHRNCRRKTLSLKMKHLRCLTPIQKKRHLMCLSLSPQHRKWLKSPRSKRMIRILRRILQAKRSLLKWRLTMRIPIHLWRMRLIAKYGTF